MHVVFMDKELQAALKGFQLQYAENSDAEDNDAEDDAKEPPYAISSLQSCCNEGHL